MFTWQGSKVQLRIWWEMALLIKGVWKCSSAECSRTFHWPEMQCTSPKGVVQLYRRLAATEIGLGAPK